MSISRRISDIEKELLPADGDDDRKTAMVAEMLVSLAGGAVDKMSIKAKQHAYRIGLLDIPAWLVRMAIDDWYRGKSEGIDFKGDDYRWPPSPGHLSFICRQLMRPYERAITDMEHVLEAKSLEETMRELM